MSNNPFLKKEEESSLAPAIDSSSTMSPVKSSAVKERTRSADRSSSKRDESAHHKGHRSRPSADLAAHDKLVRKSSRARKQIPRDSIDKLDDILGSYHHEGPFDATLASRQIPGRAPVEAVKLGNSLALAATPNAYVQKSLSAHEPLDGTGMVPSGRTLAGQNFNYDEEDVERQGGMGRWPDVEYAGSDDGGEFQNDLGDYDVHNNKSGVKGHTIEMQGSSRGVVHYTDELEDIDDISATEHVTGHSDGKQKGVLSGLKKRLSVKRH